MAVYKVIQDVEAEDKLVGFLTLKTFIYAIIAIALGYINFRLLIATQLGVARWFAIFVFLFPMLLFGILSLPLGRDQPTEVWILSRVRFFIKPRLRTWNQSGVLDYVTITAPKKIERVLTKNLTQREVRSRLKALATTLDSRGWAVRNVAVNLNASPDYLDIHEDNSDRLVGGSNLPKNQQMVDIHESDDIMDAQNNPTAQHFEALMQQEDAKRKKAVSEIVSNQKQDEDGNPPPDYSFLDKTDAINEEGNTKFVGHSIVSPGTAASDDDADDTKEQIDPELAEAERAYLEKERKKAEEVHAKSAGFRPKSHSKAKKDSARPKQAAAKKQSKKESTSVTQAAQTAKLEELAQSGSAFSVATMQKLANRGSENIRQIGPNEVEIDLRH